MEKYLASGAETLFFTPMLCILFLVMVLANLCSCHMDMAVLGDNPLEIRPKPLMCVCKAFLHLPCVWVFAQANREVDSVAWWH